MGLKDKCYWMSAEALDEGGGWGNYSFNYGEEAMISECKLKAHDYNEVFDDMDNQKLFVCPDCGKPLEVLY